MLAFRLTISSPLRKELDLALKSAQRLGNAQLLKRLLAVLAYADGQNVQQIAHFLKVSPDCVERWIVAFLCYKLKGLQVKKSPGRKPKLSKDQKLKLASLIDAGPLAAGFASACWRSPMIQHLILEQFGVFYSVFYISQLLKSLGFSFQKAAFVSDHLDEAKRKEWKEKTFPQILALARQKKAYLLFGDEASFPQWGTLSYTWARRGHQPSVKTCGKRRAYKVLGLIDYFSGKFFYKTTEQRLDSASYEEFLREVLALTDRHIILIQDQAKYHTSSAIKKFFAANKHRLTVFDLPSYSPDFNPIEKLWKKIKQQETHMHYFPTYDSLKQRVEQAMVKFANTPKQILALFGLAA
jgi:transposase